MSYDNIVGDKNSLFNSETNPTFLLPFLKIICQHFLTQYIPYLEE